MSLAPASRLARNVGWIFLGQGASYLLRILYFVAIARLLGVVQCGLVVGAFALVNIVAQYSRLGTGMVFLRYVSVDREHFSVYWGNILLTTLPLGIVLALLLSLLAPHLIDPRSASIVVFTAIGSCVCEELTISATQVFQSFEKMRTTAVLNLLTSLVRALAAVMLLLTLGHASAWLWALVSMLVSIGAAVAALTLVTRTFGAPRFSLRLFRRHALEGLGYSFASSTANAYDDLDKAMLSHYGMNAAVGVYALAYRIIEMATMPVASIQLAAEPRLFQLGAAGLRQSADLGHRLLVRALLFSSVTAVVLFLMSPLLPLVAGHSFQESASALRWLCLIPVFRSVHYITGSVLTCGGLQRLRTAAQAAAAALNFGINLWLIPRYGWHGAAWSSLVTDGVLALANLTTLQWTLHSHPQLAPRKAAT